MSSKGKDDVDSLCIICINGEREREDGVIEQPLSLSCCKKKAHASCLERWSRVRSVNTNVMPHTSDFIWYFFSIFLFFLLPPF
jgi:hypothetical protein